MQKKILAALLLCCVLPGLFGCAPKQTAPEDAARTTEFRFEESSFTENGTEIPFPLDGVLGVPEGDNNPVVFILHGAHPIEDVTESRYYQGFSYLAEALAQQGYLAISININRAFSFEPVEGNENERAYQIFQAYRALLEQANAGEKRFDIDLTGKADLSRISFIGHSRGGDNGAYIAKRLSEEGQTPARGVMLVASPLNSGYTAVYSDVPMAVVLPQYDGDVVGLDSYGMFSYAYAHPETHTSPIAAAFLYGGDHSQFNTLLTEGDLLAAPQNVTIVDAETQRAFLCRYATDFLNVVNREGYDFAELLGNGAPERYGIDFMPSVLIPPRIGLLTPEDSLSGLTAEGMTVTYAQSSQLYQEDTAAPVRLPGGYDQNIPLYKIRWEQSGARVVITPKQTDFSTFRYLSLYMANDSTAPGNTVQTPTALLVTLADKQGNTASYPLGSDTATALRYIETPVENIFEGMADMPVYELATFITPLSTQLLPLTAFEGVDLTQIESVQISGESAQGAILLAGADLYRP